jgi:hypothetical protein
VSEAAVVGRVAASRRRRRPPQAALGVALIGLGVGIAVVFPSLLAFSANVPVADPTRDFIVGCVWAFALLAGVFLAPIPYEDKWPLAILWVANAAVCLVAMLPYEAHYSLDAFWYFSTAQAGSPEWEWLSIGPGAGTRMIVALSWALLHLTPDSYHGVKISFAFIGLLGVYNCYRAAALVLANCEEARRFLFIVGFTPSVIFWSSILGKDPVVFFGIGLFAHGIVKWQMARRASALWMAGLGFVIATSIRPWLGPILLSPVALLVRPRRNLRTALAGALTIVLALSLSSVLLDRFATKGASGVSEVIANHAEGWQSSTAGSAQNLNVNLRSPAALVSFLPIGAFTALFRPLPGEVPHAFGLLAGIEGALLLGLFGRALCRVRVRDLSHPVVRWLAGTVVAWAALYAFISAFNLGAAVRFRLQILPIFVALLLFIGRRNRREMALRQVGSLRRRRPIAPTDSSAAPAGGFGGPTWVAPAGAEQSVG